MKKGSGERTLLASVLMSAPGPLVLGAALFYGQSSTQLADFIRRSAELLAIFISWTVYGIIQRRNAPEPLWKARLERIADTGVGMTMCLSGIVIMVMAMGSTGPGKGNVIPGLVIAALGALANTLFWLRYRKLNKTEPDAIMAVQSRLYLAKSAVDLCVLVTLAMVLFAPEATITPKVDFWGSLIVSVYLILNGTKILTGMIRSLKSAVKGEVSTPSRDR